MNAGCDGRSGALCVQCVLACMYVYIMPVLYLYVLYVVNNASVSVRGGGFSILHSQCVSFSAGCDNRVQCVSPSEMLCELF